MRTTAGALVASVVAVATGGTAAQAATTPPEAAVTVYHGTVSTTAECGQTHDASGRWRIVTRGDEATVSVTIFQDGQLHAAWGWSGFTVVPEAHDVEVVDGGLRFVLDGDALTFTVADYPCPDGTTDTAVVTGTLTG